MKKLITGVAIALAMLACSDKSVSFNTLEDARSQARSNAEYNAAAYRAENPRMSGLKIVGHGDSTQTASCPQGDGWATVSIMNVDKEKQTSEKYKVKCSTVSASLGCYLEEDFNKKEQLVTQENRCDKTLPFPLPKIAK
jgi:hypothetical protein